MSRDHLRAIVDKHVFDPRPNANWFYMTHVPFDELLRSHDVEERVTSCARAGSRVAVIGPSGCGKTSLVTYALARDPNLFPITVRVAPEKPDRVRDVTGFARLIVDTIVNDAQIVLTEEHRGQALAGASERYEAQAPRRSKRWGAHLGWSGAHVDVSREVAHYAESISYEMTTTRVTSTLEDLLATIGKRDTEPVLVIDDSDRFLQLVSADDDQEQLVTAFLSRVLPWLSELPCGKVVAIHPAYRNQRTLAPSGV
jgi:AAA ATPase domain